MAPRADVMGLPGGRRGAHELNACPTWRDAGRGNFVWATLKHGAVPHQLQRDTTG